MEKELKEKSHTSRRRQFTKHPSPRRLLRPPPRRLLRPRLHSFFLYSGSSLYDFNGQDLHLFPNPTVILPSSFSSSSSSSSSLPSTRSSFTQVPLFSISMGRISICFRIRRYSPTRRLIRSRLFTFFLYSVSSLYNFNGQDLLHLFPKSDGVLPSSSLCNSSSSPGVVFFYSSFSLYDFHGQDLHLSFRSGVGVSFPSAQVPLFS